MSEDAGNEIPWDELNQSYSRFIEERDNYLRLKKMALESLDVLTTLKSSVPGFPRELALEKASSLSTEEKKVLLPELMALASYSHGLTGRAWELILSLPHDWLISNIEEYANPQLEVGGYEEYSAFLGLYEKISPKLFQDLLERGKNHPDAEVREAMLFFVDKKN